MEQSQRLESAALAHELRTPVGALRAQVDALVDGVVDYTPDLGVQLRSHVLTLARLVEDLRALSLARIGQLQIDVQEHELDALVQSTVEAWSASALAPVRRIGATHGVVVRLDATRFRQVLHNLLQNAHQHGAPPIVLEVSAVGGTAIVTLRDHGPGLAASDTRRSAGDGLGLRVVTQLSNALGMAFTIRDAADGGVVASLAMAARAPSVDRA
jgi:two-component system sensor histidine kinase AdeS